MHELADHFLLFARPWNMRELSKGFHGIDAKDNAIQTLIVGMIIIAVCGALLMFDRYARGKKEARSTDDPAELFRDLCRIHHLDRGSRRFLKRLAAVSELSTPALLFVEPERFNPAKLPPDWQRRANDLEQLRERLLDVPSA